MMSIYRKFAYILAVGALAGLSLFAAAWSFTSQAVSQHAKTQVSAQVPSQILVAGDDGQESHGGGKGGGKSHG